MSDRDDLAPSLDDPIAADVGERVTAVLRAAEDAAGAIRHQAEQEAQAKRRQTEEEVERYAEAKKREADELLAQRLQRIADVSDGLVERSERITSRLDEAEDLKRKMQGLVEALGDAAEDLAREMAQPDRPALSVVRAERAAAEERPESPKAPDRGVEPELSALDRLKAAAATGRDGEAARPERRGRFQRDSEPEERPDPGEDRLLGARLVALQMAVAGSDRREVERHLRNAFQTENPEQILDEVFGKAESQA